LLKNIKKLKAKVNEKEGEGKKEKEKSNFDRMEELTKTLMTKTLTENSVHQILTLRFHQQRKTQMQFC
jgi:hypothetical protein